MKQVKIIENWTYVGCLGNAVKELTNRLDEIDAITDVHSLTIKKNEKNPAGLVSWMIDVRYSTKR